MGMIMLMNNRQVRLKIYPFKLALWTLTDYRGMRLQDYSDPHPIHDRVPPDSGGLVTFRLGVTSLAVECL